MRTRLTIHSEKPWISQTLMEKISWRNDYMISNKEEMTSSRPEDKDVTPTRWVKSRQMIFETSPSVQRTKKLSLKNDPFCERTSKREITKMLNITLMCSSDCFERISLSHWEKVSMKLRKIFQEDNAIRWWNATKGCALLARNLLCLELITGFNLMFPNSAWQIGRSPRGLFLVHSFAFLKITSKQCFSPRLLIETQRTCRKADFIFDSLRNKIFLISRSGKRNTRWSSHQPTLKPIVTYLKVSRGWTKTACLSQSTWLNVVLK